MEFHLEPNGTEPLYQQLARQLRQRIVGGAWEAGRQLPSARELSGELGLNFLTVNKVYQLLEQEGLVEVRRGMGTFVARRPASALEKTREAMLDELIDTLLRGARQLGLKDKEISRRLKQRISETEEEE